MIATDTIYNVGVYIRLSKEDEKVGESESITNQRSLLLRYVKENGYNLFDTYIDDGYSGTNFDRPDFIRMIKDIEKGNINMVVTKDMSRLGRDYIGTGDYVEKYFPMHNVRYVALTDGIDTKFNSANNDIAPFKAIMNDMYAKDISKKIITSLRTKQKDGKWVGGCPPFGYTIDKLDKNHLVPEKIESEIVKKIFSLANSGLSIYAIKEYLINKNVPTSSMLRHRKSKNDGLSKEGIWNYRTIKGILTNQLYTGDLVQNRRNKVNYKIKKIKYNPKSEWIIVKNTHEALVDKEVFNNIQNMFSKISNRIKTYDERVLDGLLYCYECKHKISICKPRKSDNRTYMACNYYRMYSKLNVCTSHGFNYDSLEMDVLNILKDFYGKLDLENITNKLFCKCKSDFKNNDILRKVELLKTELKNKESNLDKLYIDKLDENITVEMFKRISVNINDEIDSIKSKIHKYEECLKKYDCNKFCYDDCLNLIKNCLYNDKEARKCSLKLIDKIEIHKNKEVDIYFNFSS